MRRFRLTRRACGRTCCWTNPFSGARCEHGVGAAQPDTRTGGARQGSAVQLARTGDGGTGLFARSDSASRENCG
jgi:hypothetical protein